MHLYSQCTYSLAYRRDFDGLFRYKRAEDAKMALEQMDGFELAGRTVRASMCLVMFLDSLIPSFESTPSTRKDLLVTLNKILWMKPAVSYFVLCRNEC